MNALARPFVLVSAAYLQETAERLAAVISAWCEEWRQEPLEIGLLRVEEMSEGHPHGSWLAWTNASSPDRPAYEWEAFERQAIAASVVSVQHATALLDAPEDLVWDLVAEARSALLLRCLEALAPGAWTRGARRANTPNGLDSPGSGYLAVRHEALCLHMLLPVPVPQSDLRRSRALQVQRLDSAVNRQRVRVRAVAGAAEIAVGDLASLCVGDVVRLDTRIDDPIVIQGPDGRPLLHARPGQTGGRIAAQCTAPVPSNTNK